MTNETEIIRIAGNCNFCGQCTNWPNEYCGWCVKNGFDDKDKKQRKKTMRRKVGVSILDDEKYTIDLYIYKSYEDKEFHIGIPTCEKDEMVIPEGQIKELANAFRQMANLLDGL